MGANELLNQAGRCLDAGRIDHAREILKEVTKKDPDNIHAWLQLSEIVEDPQQHIHCLQKAMEIDPNHREVRLALDHLSFRDTQPVTGNTEGRNSQPLQPGTEAEEMSFCASCGNAVSRGDRYCSRCGTFLGESTSHPSFSKTRPMYEGRTACTRCGEPVEIKESQESTRCESCGARLAFHETGRSFNDKADGHMGQLVEMAFYAEKEERYQDAYEYYSQILEQSPAKQTAWLGKGRCLGWMSSPGWDRIQEATFCVKRGVKLEPYQPALMHALSREFIHIAERYSGLVLRDLESRALYVEAGIDSTEALRELAAKLEQVKLNRELRKEFTTQYLSSIRIGVRFAWVLHRNAEVAHSVFHIHEKLHQSPVLGPIEKKSVDERFASVLVDIREQYPTWESPVMGVS